MPGPLTQSSTLVLERFVNIPYRSGIAVKVLVAHGACVEELSELGSAASTILVTDTVVVVLCLIPP
jgi:hypothetical protein